jgi:hypothetical protein
MNRRLALAVLVALLLLSGCAEKNSINMSEKMRMSSINGINVDGKGNDEASLYEFAPLNVVPSDPKAGSVVIKKYMFAYPTQYDIAFSGAMRSSDLAEYVNASSAYLDSLQKGCKMDVNACITPATCKASCGIAACKSSKLNDIGYIMGDLASLIRQKRSLTNDLRKELSGYGGANATDMASRLFVRAEIIDAAISTHPAVTAMGICPKVPPAETEIRPFAINTTKFNIIVIYDAIGSALQRNAAITVQDSIPAEFSNKASLRNVMDSATYSTEPNIQVKFNELDINSSNSEYLAYSMDSSAENSQLTYVAMDKGSIDITFFTTAGVDIEGPVSELNRLFAPINAAAKLPRLSFVLSIATVYLLFLTALQALASAYAALSAVRTGGDARAAALESLGLANPAWVEAAVVCAVLFAAGIYMESGAAAKLSIAALDSRNLYDIVPMNDIAALIGIAIYMFAAYLAVDVLLDRAKAIVGGKYYSRNIIRYSAAEIEKGIKELREGIKKAFQEIGRYSDRGIGTNDEYKRVAAISLDGLDALFKKGDFREAYRQVEEYRRTIAESILIVKNKEKTAMINHDKWMGMLKDELKASEGDKVNVDTLIEIPAEWRLWVVRKFIDDNKEEGWVLEGNTLKKSGLPESERIAALMHTMAKDGRIVSGAVFNRTVYAGGYFGFGKESINLALSNRIIRFLLSLGQMIDKTKNVSFSSYGKTYSIYVRGRNGISVMLISNRRIDDAVDGIADSAIRMVGK